MNPPGNLDSRTADAVLTLFSELASDGQTVLMVTHERDIPRFAHQHIMLADGRIEPKGVARAAHG